MRSSIFAEWWESVRSFNFHQVNKLEIGDGLPGGEVQKDICAPASDGDGCCMGRPGATNLVGCVTNYLPGEEVFKKLKVDPKVGFGQICQAVVGVRGIAGSVSSTVPKHCQFDDEHEYGTIPEDYLIGADLTKKLFAFIDE